MSPVILAPAKMGIGIFSCWLETLFSSSPIRRLKKSKRSGADPSNRGRSVPKSKIPAPSRKNSRFSGKKRENRVRFNCAASTSAWAKSGLMVKSAVNEEVRETFKSSIPTWDSFLKLDPEFFGVWLKPPTTKGLTLNFRPVCTCFRSVKWPAWERCNKV